MKKHLKTMAALTASLTVLSTAAAFGGITASAAATGDVTVGNVTYTVYNTYAVVKSCSKNAVNVTIPDKVSNKPVTRIQSSAFKDCNKLKNVKLTKNITTIYSSAFRNCTGLTEIVIPYQVSWVAGYTFAGCTNLKWITVDNPYMQMSNNAAPNYAFIFWNWRSLDDYERRDKSDIPDQIGNCPVHVFGFGDMNFDGETDMADAQGIQNYAVAELVQNNHESEFARHYSKAMADLNRDGSVCVDDAQLELNYSVEAMCGNVDVPLVTYMYEKMYLN